MKKSAFSLRNMLKRYRMLLKVAVLVITVCLVIICGFLVAVNNIYRTSNIEREIVENEAIVEQISREFSDSIYDINDMSLSIYANQRINSAIMELYNEPEMDIVRSLALKSQISNSLQTYRDMNEMIVCCQIYLDNNPDPITIGELSARQVSEITKEYQKDLQEKVFATGGELQVYPMECKRIIFTRALGDFNSGKKNEDYIYGIVLVLSDPYINKIMDKLYYSNYSHGKMICLLDEDGSIVHSTNRDSIGTSAEELGLNLSTETEKPKTYKTKKSIYSVEYDPNICHYIMVATELNEIDLYADTFRVSTFTIILSIGAVLLIVLFVLTTVIGRPVQDLINSIKRIGIDRESVKLVDIGDGGDIALSFNEAITRVEHIIDAQYQNEIKQKNARIAILQLQINPHFIFNTLETISWSVYKEDKEQSIKMITALGRILRYTTYNYSKMVSVIEEINIIEKYLYFEEVRHGGFKTEIYVDPQLEDFKIPCLLLQPIVENSCIHGIRDKENGHISISIRKVDDYAEIVIADNGKGMSCEQIENLLQSDVMHGEDDEHIGISNVKERVYSAFGKKASFAIDSVVGEYMKVIMKLPVNEVNHD